MFCALNTTMKICDILPLGIRFQLQSFYYSRYYLLYHNPFTFHNNTTPSLLTQFSFYSILFYYSSRLFTQVTLVERLTAMDDFMGVVNRGLDAEVTYCICSVYCTSLVKLVYHDVLYLFCVQYCTALVKLVYYMYSDINRLSFLDVFNSYIIS